MSATKQTARRSAGRPPRDQTSTSAKILAVACQLFSDQGYASTTMRDIADRAGVSAPTVYHHFDNKAGMYVAVLRDINSRVLRSFRDAVITANSVSEALHAVLDATADLQRSQPALGAFVVVAPIEIARHVELTDGRSELREFTRFIEELSLVGGSPLSTADPALRAMLMTIIFGASRMSATLSPSAYANYVQNLKRSLPEF